MTAATVALLLLLAGPAHVPGLPLGGLAQPGGNTWPGLPVHDYTITLPIGQVQLPDRYPVLTVLPDTYECVALLIRGDTPAALVDAMRTLPKPQSARTVNTTPGSPTCDTLRVVVGGETVLRLRTPRLAADCDHEALVHASRAWLAMTDVRRAQQPWGKAYVDAYWRWLRAVEACR